MYFTQMNNNFEIERNQMPSLKAKRHNDADSNMKEVLFWKSANCTFAMNKNEVTDWALQTNSNKVRVSWSFTNKVDDSRYDSLK